MPMVSCRKRRLLREDDNKKGTVEINFTARKGPMAEPVSEIEAELGYQQFCLSWICNLQVYFSFFWERDDLFFLVLSCVIIYLFSSLNQAKESFISISPCFRLGGDTIR